MTMASGAARARAFAMSVLSDQRRAGRPPPCGSLGPRPTVGSAPMGWASRLACDEYRDEFSYIEPPFAFNAPHIARYPVVERIGPVAHKIRQDQ